MKKFFSLFMALVLLSSVLAACGNSGSSSAAGSSETFLIGGIGPLTGPAASYGISVKQGAEIAIKEINDAGGVKAGDKTYKLELAFEDDEATEAKAVTAYQTLADKKINALMGTVTSGACLAIISDTEKDGILQITPSASAPDCIKNSNAFRICFDDFFQGETMAAYAVEQLGHKKVAVIYHNDSDYSLGMAEAFKKKVESLGGTVVAYEASGEKDVDFTTQLTKIKASDAEILFFPGYYEPAAKIASQAKDQGISLPIIGGDGWDGVLKSAADPATVENVVFSSPFSPTLEEAKDFVEAYKAAYKDTPDQFAADGYDAIYTMKAALEEAKSVDSAALIAAMTKIEVKGLTGTMTFSAEGVPNKEVKLIVIKDGNYELLK